MQLKDTKPGDRVVLIGTVQAPDDHDEPGHLIVLAFDIQGVTIEGALGGRVPCEVVPPEEDITVVRHLG